MERVIGAWRNDWSAARFSWPQDIEDGRKKLVLKPTALAMLTDGIDLRDGLQRPWYEAPRKEN